MNPTSNKVHVDRLLTNLSIGYKNADYIADNIFPVVPVTKRSDIVPKYDQSHWFRNGATKRAPGTKSEGGGWKVNTDDTYYADRYSFRTEIDDDTRDNADMPFNLDREGTEFVTDKMYMAREVSFASDFFTTGKWGADKVGTVDFAQWSNYATSSPLTDVDEYKDVAEGKIARELRTGVIGKQVWLKLKWHPDLVDTIKYTQKGQVSVELAAGLMELDNLYIGRGILTTSNEGVAESSVVYTRIWGKHMLLCYVPKSPSLMTPAAGYNFVWKSEGFLQYIKRMRDEEREVDIIEGNSYFDQKITAAAAGVFLQNTVG